MFKNFSWMNMKVLNLLQILHGFIEIPHVWCRPSPCRHCTLTPGPIAMFQLQSLLNLTSAWAVPKLWFFFFLFFPLVFILAFCPRCSGSSGLVSQSLIVHFLRRRETHLVGSNGQANKPPLHRCTSWSQCLGFVWLGGWWDRGTGLRSPPLWVPSAEFGKKSDTCCLLPEAVCGSLLQEEEKRN